jgi:hypothetical protein
MGKSGSDKINPARRRRRVAFCKSSPRNQLQAHGLLVSSTQRFGSPEAYTPRPLAEKILTSKSALEGERKQVTVLFACRLDRVLAWARPAGGAGRGDETQGSGARKVVCVS